MMNVGKRINEFRKGQHLTLKQFGSIVGVSSNTVYRWERGCIPRIGMMRNICGKFGLPDNYFYLEPGQATAGLQAAGDKNFVDMFCDFPENNKEPPYELKVHGESNDQIMEKVLLEGFKKLPPQKKNELIGYLTLLEVN